MTDVEKSKIKEDIEEYDYDKESSDESKFEKPKRNVNYVLTEKRKEAFERARIKRAKNIEKRKKGKKKKKIKNKNLIKLNKKSNRRKKINY